jgi:hypothetical protein
MQSAVQLGRTTLAVQFTWQPMLICTVQDSVQAVWHWVSQETVGAVAWHPTSQRFEQSSMQSLGQLAFVTVEHLSVQLFWQSWVQAAEQEKLPGFALQSVVQAVKHGPMTQVGSAATVHWPSHSATKLPGVHSAVQVAGVVTNSQVPEVSRLQAAAPLAAPPSSASAAEEASIRGATRRAMKCRGMGKDMARFSWGGRFYANLAARLPSALEEHDPDDG